MVIQPN